MHWYTVELEKDCNHVICEYDGVKRIFHNGKIEFDNFDGNIKNFNVFILIEEKDHFHYLFQTCGKLPCSIILNKDKYIMKIEIKGSYFAGGSEAVKDGFLMHKYIDEIDDGNIIIHAYMNKNKWINLLELFKNITRFNKQKLFDYLIKNI
jgi:hypothetical protein